MNSFSKEQRFQAVEMWNSGIPRSQIEKYLGISYPISSLISQWRGMAGIKIVSRRERAEAVAIWNSVSAQYLDSPEAAPDQWEAVYAQLRARSGGKMVPSVADIAVDVVISVMVNGEEVSRKTTRVLAPANRASQGGM